MKTTKMSIMALAVALSTAACNNPEPSTDDHHENGSMEEHHDEGEHMHNGDADHMHEDAGQMHENENSQAIEMVQTQMSEETAQKLTSGYLELKQALVQSDAKAANTAAKNISKELEGTEDELGREIHSAAKGVVDADDIEQQRKNFESLSMNMYHLAKQVETGEDLYWQHCPMAMDNKGANWLSDSKEILNPYFGDRMLKCGRVEEKI